MFSLQPDAQILRLINQAAWKIPDWQTAAKNLGIPQGIKKIRGGKRIISAFFSLSPRDQEMFRLHFPKFTINVLEKYFTNVIFKVIFIEFYILAWKLTNWDGAAHQREIVAEIDKMLKKNQNWKWAKK